MTPLTIDAAKLARIVKAVEKSAAREDARPVLAGIHASVTDDTLTRTADQFRRSTARGPSRCRPGRVRYGARARGGRQTPWPRPRSHC
jgi:hypothetical protein